MITWTWWCHDPLTGQQQGGWSTERSVYWAARKHGWSRPLQETEDNWWKPCRRSPLTEDPITCKISSIHNNQNFKIWTISHVCNKTVYKPVYSERDCHNNPDCKIWTISHVCDIAFYRLFAPLVNAKFVKFTKFSTNVSHTFSPFAKFSPCSWFGKVQNSRDYSVTLTFWPKIPKVARLGLFTKLCKSFAGLAKGTSSGRHCSPRCWQKPATGEHLGIFGN